MKSHFPSSYHVCDQFRSLLLICSLLMFLLFLLYLEEEIFLPILLIKKRGIFWQPTNQQDELMLS